MNLKDKAKQLPESPGVYIMKDFQGEIIYIGKAKSLKNRVSQYFRKSSRHAPKILRMVEGIRDFNYIPADTELEALLLECRLIKEFKPIYNSQLKNHQKYVYINIPIEEQYPTMEIVSEKQEKGLNFGPYTSLGGVERAVVFIKDKIKLRHCSSFVRKSSGCLNHQLGFCMAPCAGAVSANEYRLLIEEAIAFINGGKTDWLKLLERKMLSAAEELDFAKAAKHRDDLKALKHLINKQKTIKFTGSKLIAALEKICVDEYKLIIIKGSRIIYKEKVNISLSKEMLIKHFTELIYEYKEEILKNDHITIEKAEIDQAQIIYSYLRNKKDCHYILIPKSWLNKNGIDKLRQGVEKLTAPQ